MTTVVIVAPVCLVYMPPHRQEGGSTSIAAEMLSPNTELQNLGSCTLVIVRISALLSCCCRLSVFDSCIPLAGQHAMYQAGIIHVGILAKVLQLSAIACKAHYQSGLQHAHNVAQLFADNSLMHRGCLVDDGVAVAVASVNVIIAQLVG
jgi:hypothetical protein